MLAGSGLCHCHAETATTSLKDSLCLAFAFEVRETVAWVLEADSNPADETSLELIIKTVDGQPREVGNDLSLVNTTVTTKEAATRQSILRRTS